MTVGGIWSSFFTWVPALCQLWQHVAEARRHRARLKHLVEVCDGQQMVIEDLLPGGKVKFARAANAEEASHSLRRQLVHDARMFQGGAELLGSSHGS